jgi:hypothetical protein
MSKDAELAKLVRQYLASKTSFDDLFDWVQNQEPYWGTLPVDSPARSLAGIVSLMAYEVWDGARPEPEAREVIRQEVASLARA